MKNILFILFLFSLSASAQNIDMEKDTIQMKEVVVNEKKKNGRQISYKFRRGICTFYDNLSSVYETATMAYDMPRGMIKSLRFEFNHSAKRDDKGKYADTEIELNLYDVKANGDPGEKLGSKTFLVPGSHSGKMNIDVSDLQVRNETGIYVALRKVKKENSKATDFEVDCSCKENKNHKTLIYNPKSEKWLQAHGPYAFELTVTIEQ
ncbi:hypothetical protein OGH69_04305 [Flavobacterium sp. MFBS3-15]|uniref:hypothetical protein n=1 Tax=Flavobacterium sp. MFBS3-15 TaxID=2989816 RepID=UPI002236B821|nr:hypothetical protein [Flavobacterium sp. MFBS3-15]MCW4468179.1 hypothetical protein [Flavobacterium sp. MFBS3-15]